MNWLLREYDLRRAHQRRDIVCKFHKLVPMAAGLLLPLTAHAQDAEAKPFSALFTYPPALSALIVSLVVAWMLSVVITAVFSGKHYEPKVAKLALWLSMSLWVIGLFLGIIGWILHITLPIWSWALVGAFILATLVLVMGSKGKR